MSIEAIVARWGVAAVFTGAMLEGETAVIAGGLLAHQGLIAWPLALAAAALGSFLSDQFFFAAGRRYRDRPFVQRWTQKRAFAKALRLLERYPTGFIFGFRFLYGFRTVSPVAKKNCCTPLGRLMRSILLSVARLGRARRKPCSRAARQVCSR